MRRYILWWITHWKLKKNSSLVYHVIIRSKDGDLVAKFPTLSLSQAATLFDERRRFSCEIPYPVSHRQPPCLTIVTHERNTMKWNVLQLRIKHQINSFFTQNHRSTAIWCVTTVRHATLWEKRKYSQHFKRFYFWVRKSVWHFSKTF